MPGMYNLIVS